MPLIQFLSLLDEFGIFDWKAVEHITRTVI